MKNVNRFKNPDSLQKNAKKWTSELQNELKKGARADKKRLKRLE